MKRSMQSIEVWTHDRFLTIWPAQQMVPRALRGSSSPDLIPILQHNQTRQIFAERVFGLYVFEDQSNSRLESLVSRVRGVRRGCRDINSTTS